MTYRNKLGTFVFGDGVPLSLAKLVVQTVTGQWYFPKPGVSILHDEEQCYSFIRNHDSHVLAGVKFEMYIR